MHIKGENMDSGWLLGQLLGECLGLLHQDRWSKVHKVFNKHFERRISTTYLPYVEHRVQEHLSLFQQTNELAQGQYLLRTSEDLKLLAFLTIADVLYGPLSSQLDQQLRNLIPLRERLWQMAIKGGFSRFSISQYFPSETNRMLREFQRKWRGFNHDALERAKRDYPDSPIVSLFDAMEKGDISNVELLHTLDEILFANLDVTVGNFSWNPVFLAAYPEVQNELYKEISRCARSKQPSWGYITRNDTMLMACIRESARLKPMAAFSLAQAAPTERIIDGFVIPARTNFLVDSNAVNILDPFWGEDSDVYRPQRFLEMQRATSLRYQFWRFGFGPRQCLGRDVADLLLKVMLMRLVENFHLDLRTKDARGMDEWAQKPDV